MPYVTLQEAAQIVNHQTGVDITAPQLIRFAANSGLPLCVLLNEKCYSPTKTTRRETKAAELDPDYWSKSHADDVVLDDAYGLYVLPPRHVFDYQSRDTIRIDYVTSLDGLDTYKTDTDVSRDALQVTLSDLEKLIEHIKRNKPDTEPEQTHPAPTVEAVTPAPVTNRRWTPEKLAELKAYREAHTMKETAAKFGIAEQRIRQLLPSDKPKAKPFAGLIHRMK